jgi:Uma2 family endonuclease
MASPPDMRPISPEEYLLLERRADYKSEYYAGEIVAMTGASREHNLIAGNLVTSLNLKLRDRPCEVYPGDMRVKVQSTGRAGPISAEMLDFCARAA